MENLNEKIILELRSMDEERIKKARKRHQEIRNRLLNPRKANWGRDIESNNSLKQEKKQMVQNYRLEEMMQKKKIKDVCSYLQRLEDEDMARKKNISRETALYLDKMISLKEAKKRQSELEEKQRDKENEFINSFKFMSEVDRKKSLQSKLKLNLDQQVINAKIKQQNELVTKKEEREIQEKNLKTLQLLHESAVAKSIESQHQVAKYNMEQKRLEPRTFEFGDPNRFFLNFEKIRVDDKEKTEKGEDIRKLVSLSEVQDDLKLRLDSGKQKDFRNDQCHLKNIRTQEYLDFQNKKKKVDQNYKTRIQLDNQRKRNTELRLVEAEQRKEPGYKDCFFDNFGKSHR
eukprot:snap_masked-scaffold_3-processed-gene-9.12-mRNA-1 protein AED:1.00 eAED:1.00 QI:0/-1/0/0/-1/1/1/0/344